MSKRELYKQLCTRVKLPSPSEVALEITRLCYSDDSSLQDIARVVETDPALSSELLKYANSALLSSMMPVASVQQAAVKIGMKGIVNLALGFAVLSQHKSGGCRNFNYSRFWSKSLAQAVAGRAVASVKKTVDPDEIFTIGLLSHMGSLALATAFPEQYSSILMHEYCGSDLYEAEQNSFGLDQHELTVEMFHDWGLPKPYALAAGYHENYRQEIIHDEEVAQIAEMLHLALQISDICMLELPLERTFGYIEELSEKFGIAHGSFSSFFNTVAHTWQDWGHLFNIPTQQCPLYHQIKSLDGTPTEEKERAVKSTELLILAVDDDPLTLLNLRRMLARDNRKIITAEDGDQAFQIVLEQQPGMVITDWRMPNMDGLELCRLLRQTPTTQHTYIIMLTSNESDDELVQAFAAGADDYVVKQFTPKVLEARIRSGERIIAYQRRITRDREVIHQYANRLASANRRLQTMAMTDALTELPNRRNAMARMKDLVAESSRFSEKLSCILIDIDNFKNINDTYGHDIGDLVLQEIAKVFSSTARSYDMVSRMGGEEFLVISTRSDGDDSQQLAERLRSAVEKHRVLLSDGMKVGVTISLGVATWSDEYANGSEFIKAADTALYRAKYKGRNRVETAWSDS